MENSQKATTRTINSFNHRKENYKQQTINGATSNIREIYRDVSAAI